MTPHVSITLLRTQTDERLVELIAAGHERAFDAIVDRYRRPLLRYAGRFCKEDGRAEDVVQAAFVSAWTALSEGTAVRDLRPWLYRIVHNGALNTMNKPGGDDVPLIEASDTRPGPEAEIEQREDVRQALDTIAGLPERQRAALLAVALEGRSHADVGEDLGINDTAVRQLVSRARASVRVAATAVTPWPVAVWIAGIGGPQTADAATRVGELVGGVGAGTLFGGGAVKAGALIAATGAVAVGAPQVAHVARQDSRPAIAAPAAARSAGHDQPSPGGSSVPPAGTIVSGSSQHSEDSGSGASGSRGDSGSGSGSDHGRGEDSEPRHSDRSREDRSDGGDRHGSRDEDSGHRGSDDRSEHDTYDDSRSEDSPSDAHDEDSKLPDPDEHESIEEPEHLVEPESGSSGSGSRSGSREGSDDPPVTVTVPQTEPSS